MAAEIRVAVPAAPAAIGKRMLLTRHTSLADAHGLIIMRERKIAMCWSTDTHLALLGAALIISM
jgi:hypothetical protein